ncbi:MAG: enoyl-CoA hydratase/isomerase family protein [Lysobacterales bacterium]
MTSLEKPILDTEQLVTLRRQGKIAIVSLNRPTRHNALVPELLSRLLQVLEHQDCQDAAVVILRAEGRSFSTGGDLSGFQDHRETIGDYAQELVGKLNQVILTIYTHPAVMVCAVHGQVTGGAIGLLLASDRVIIRRGASITPYYSLVGFSPDGGWTALLPDIIGRQQCMNWLAGNTSKDADTCLALGLVHQVVENDCDASALDWAKIVAGHKTHSITRTRKLLNTNIEHLRHRLEAERESFVSQVQTRQALDGIDSFLRRKEHV